MGAAVTDATLIPWPKTFIDCPTCGSLGRAVWRPKGGAVVLHPQRNFPCRIADVEALQEYIEAVGADD